MAYLVCYALPAYLTCTIVCSDLQSNFDVSIDIRVNNSNTGVSGLVGSTLDYQVIL
jgi:hypothetical protein